LIYFLYFVGGNFYQMKAGLDIWGYIFAGVSFGFAAAVQPGPLLLYLISETLRSGWKRTLPAVFSPLITDGPIALVCLLLLSTLPWNFLQLIQVCGGLFILYLAVRAYHAWKRYREMALQPASSRKTLLTSVIVNFLNPGPYLGWSLVIGPMFLRGWKENPLHGIMVVSSFYLVLFCTTIAIMLIFHLARERGPRLQRTLIGISAIFLALFGLYQIYTGGQAFWK
jgi:threonine/homoserine/homoserine lactone efflux protein